MPSCSDSKNHPGVVVTYRTGDLGCPLCGALNKLRTAMTPDRVETLIEWIKNERDEWKKRAEKAERDAVVPYGLDPDDELNGG
jgi:hypothetical protein